MLARDSILELLCDGGSLHEHCTVVPHTGLTLVLTVAGKAMGYAVHERTVQQPDRLGLAPQAFCWQNQE